MLLLRSLLLLSGSFDPTDRNRFCVDIFTSGGESAHPLWSRWAVAPEDRESVAAEMALEMQQLRTLIDGQWTLVINDLEAKEEEIRLGNQPRIALLRAEMEELKATTANVPRSQQRSSDIRRMDSIEWGVKKLETPCASALREARKKWTEELFLHECVALLEQVLPHDLWPC